MILATATNPSRAWHHNPACKDTFAHVGSCDIVAPGLIWLGEIMVALKTERRAFLWYVSPVAAPPEAKKTVTLDEIVTILEAELAAKRARVYLSDAARLLEDDDPNRDEKNQIFIAKIRRDPKHKTVTLLINRGDPNAVSPAFINSETSAVRVEHPKAKESPGWSAHLVISTTADGTQHRACFEKMPHVSSFLVLSAIDKMLARVVHNDPQYTYEIEVKKGTKIRKTVRSYRPSLTTKRVPSENLEKDLESGELSSVTLTKQKIFYTGVGAKDLIKRQEEKIVIRTAPADKPKVAAFIKGLTTWAKEEKFEAISFKLEKLPGGATNNPTLLLDNLDALEQLYVRAQRLTGFKELLEACYSDICDEIETKMIAVVNGKHGW